MNALIGKGGKIFSDPKFDLNCFATCVYDITGVKKFCEINFSNCFIDGKKKKILFQLGKNARCKG